MRTPAENKEKWIVVSKLHKNEGHLTEENESSLVLSAMDEWKVGKEIKLLRLSRKLQNA